MAEETAPQAKHYQAMKNRLFLFNIVLNFLFLSAFMALGWSGELKQRLAFAGNSFFARNALYFFFLAIFMNIVSFPLGFYEGFILEHKFALSRQTLLSWLKDELKKGTIGFFISLVLLEAVYYFLLVFEQTWWVWAALFWFFVSVLLARIAPQVILPLFYKYTPLEAGPLRETVLEFLERFKVRLKDVYVLDFSKKTVKANAMVAGLGRTKQIFFSDTLIREFSSEEVIAVLAHEMGHYLKHDTVKLSFVSLGSGFFACFIADLSLKKLFPYFGLEVLSDIAGLPLLMIALMFAGIILMPLQNGFSRFLETKADLFALTTTKDSKSFISLMQRLGERNFSEFTPSKWVEIFLYDHPSLSQRIKFASGFSYAQE